MVTSLFSGKGLVVLAIGTISYMMFSEIFKQYFTALDGQTQVIYFVLTAFFALLLLSSNSDQTNR